MYFEVHHSGPPAIVVAAFKEVGVTPTIVFYPWERAEDEVRQGNAFAAFPYAVTPDRQKEFDFSNPMYTVQAKFFYSKLYHPNGIPYNTLQDLRNYKIGALLGSWYVTTFADAGLQVEYVSSNDQNVQKLGLGRIDLMVEEENTVWSVIRKLYPNDVDQFATLDKPLDQPGVVNDLSSHGFSHIPEFSRIAPAIQHRAGGHSRQWNLRSDFGEIPTRETVTLRCPALELALIVFTHL